MSEGPEPMLPLRLGALLTIGPSVRVRVSARADALQINAPFGDLTVPYSLITSVTGLNGGIRLDLAGATVQLEFSNLPDLAVNALLDLLEHDRRAPKS